MSGQVKRIDITSEDQWHELRARHVGGSEIAALFDEHPQLTRFELWHRKAGNVPEPELSDDERIFWGQILEPAIAVGVGKRTPWEVRKARYYLSSASGVGGSIDYELHGDARGPGVLEIKTADWLIYRDWNEGEPPLNYQLQMQTYLALRGWSWGVIAVLVGGNDLKIIPYEARPATHSIIEREVAKFWESVRAAAEPQPVFADDGDTISQLYGKGGAGIVDMRGDNYLASLCAVYKAASARGREAEDERKAAKAEILTKIGRADKVMCDGFTISMSDVAAAMVSYERSAYRTFTVTAKKEKAA